jgi:hypothetical protein
MPVVLGPALSRHAIPGGQANPDQIEAQKLAGLRRGGRLPQASVDSADRRATRALLRRRLHLMHHRAARLPQVQHTNSPDHLPELGRQIADPTNRDGVAARLADPAGPKSRDVERSLLHAAKPPDANTRDRLRTVPGLGERRRRVRRAALHAIPRGPRGHAGASDGRLVQGAPASAGTREGPAGPPIGHASRTGAVCEAAGRFLRAPPAGPHSLGRLAPTHRQGQALTALAHQLARAVEDLWPPDTAFARHTFRTGSRERRGRAGRLTGP